MKSVIDTRSYLLSLQDLAQAINLLNYHGNVLLERPLRASLVEETLSDGSKVYNLDISEDKSA